MYDTSVFVRTACDACIRRESLSPLKADEDGASKIGEEEIVQTEGGGRFDVPLGGQWVQAQQCVLWFPFTAVDCTFYDEVQHGEDHFAIGDVVELCASGKQPSLEGDYKVRKGGEE